MIMSGSERSLPSSPAPGASTQESLSWYKRQYEQLEAELAEFQSSSKDLETELERDIERAEKRERKLKETAEDLRYQVEEWKEKHKQAKSEASAAQSSLEKEVKALRQDNLSIRQHVRDMEVANDDYERKQRTTEVSLEDMETKYNQAIERAVMLEEEVKAGEQEREALRTEAQRLKDDFSDLKIETDILRKKLDKAEDELRLNRRSLTLSTAHTNASPRSELSPTTTDASGTIFDATPLKAATSSVSDAITPPSPRANGKPVNPQPFTTPVQQKSRLSIPSALATPRQAPSARGNGHARGPSIAASSGLMQPSPAYRQSLGKPSVSARLANAPAGLPKSSSIVQLRTLRGKMQSLEERVQKARSKLPAPSDTPPRGSPRSGSALGNNITSSITIRNKRRTGTSSALSMQDVDDDTQSTPSIPRTKNPRSSIGRPSSPSRMSMAAPPRPSSRASAALTSRPGAGGGQYQPGHSRPTSRASMSGLRSHGNGYAPNASTDRIRPQSSLSTRSGTGYDGAFDEQDEPDDVSVASMNSATPRRSFYAKRTSDIGTAIPTASSGKRSSLTGVSRLPGPSRRQSAGIGAVDRPPSRSVLREVNEGYHPEEEIGEAF